MNEKSLNSKVFLLHLYPFLQYLSQQLIQHFPFRGGSTMRLSSRIGTITLFILIATGSSHAQWLDRSFQMQPGWNAVFLDVEPYPNDCQAQFNGKPVRGVWARRDAGPTVHAVVPVSQLLQTDLQWRVFYPQHSTHTDISNLTTLEACRAYLIHASEAFVWNLVGSPEIVDREWLTDGLTLTGFHTAPGETALFNQFVTDTDAGGPPLVYQLSLDGSWQQVTDLGQAITPSVAYLVKGKFLHGAGPAWVEMAYGKSFSYPRNVMRQALKLHCEPDAQRTVTINIINSEIAPASTEHGPWQSPAQPVAGPVVLRWRNTADQNSNWNNMPATIALNGAATPEAALWFAVDRLAMGQGSVDALYQSVLEISDGQGYRRHVGVSGQSLDYTGLWVGTVTLDQVSRPFLEGIEQPAEYTPAKTSFRALLHVDSQATIRMLDEVTQIWRPIAGHENGGESVLITRSAPASLISELANVQQQSGVPPPLRVSSAVFDLRDDSNSPIDPTVNGTFIPGATLTTTVVLYDSNPTNPYHHKFHPDHNWLSAPMASQIWNVSREITLFLDPQLSQDRTEPGWGDSWLRGTYSEIIAGIHRNPIKIAGTVHWRHISHVAELNGGGE
jgi:hypothetical protein